MWACAEESTDNYIVGLVLLVSPADNREVGLWYTEKPRGPATVSKECPMECHSLLWGRYGGTMIWEPGDLPG
ncbi:MAG: hypothetical protein AA931_12395 [Peptococcaceae bacterium 1109]|nr:MAG: hypothetical protein AA931_12395 [Peptococcaceae bacterium 1109]